MANYDRRILVPYLQDVCCVEMLCAKLTRDIRNCESRIQKINSYINQKITIPQQPEFSTFENKGEKIAGIEAILIGIGFICLSIWLWQWFSFFALAGILVGVVIICGASSGMKHDYDYATKRYNSAMLEYENKLKHNASIQKAIPQQQQLLQTECQFLATLKERLSNARNLRNEIYNVNIIPSRYRDIYAAYYLYDYFNTCRENDLDKIIQTMLLDEIKQQLTKIVVQNEQILLNQRIQIALQEENNLMIAESHRHEMQQIANLEKNQELQTDYQHMIAQNQLVTNFFLAADYLYKREI